MSKSENVKVSKKDFVDMIYSQVGEQFTNMLRLHEKDSDDGPLANLEDQNAACKFFGINTDAREDLRREYEGRESDRKNRISEIRTELAKKIIGLFYDILAEKLTEVTDGRNADVNLVPDKLMKLYTLEEVMECPLETEAILSRMCYLLDQYGNPLEYSEDRGTLWQHMGGLKVHLSYVDKNDNPVSNKIAESFHLPDSEEELVEALTRGIPERCRIKEGLSVNSIPYDQIGEGIPRYKFQYPDIAKIIVRMYAYRNGTTHKAYWSAKPLEKKFMSASDMVLTGLIITTKNVWSLYLKMIRREDNKLIGASEYCKKIVDTYESLPENKMFYDFKWKLGEKLPPYAQNIGLVPRGDIKTISIYMWKAGLNRANLLQGVAGCGKSWAMRRLHYRFARNYLGFSKEENIGETNRMFCPLIPIYIPMISWYKEITDEKESIITVISKIIINNTSFGPDMKDTIPEGVIQLLDDKRMLVIFDGIDECPIGEKPRIYRTIERFVDSYFGGRPTNLCIISDREVSTDNQSKMVTYVADTINSNDVGEYVKRFMWNNPKPEYENKLESLRYKDELIKRIVSLKRPEEISTAFELAQLAMISSSSDETYQKFLKKNEQGRAVALDRFYLMALLDRESREKLAAEGGDSEEHYNALCKVLSELSGKFADEDIETIDRESLMEIIIAAANGDEKLAKTYRIHLVQAGILKEYQDMINLDRKWYYSFSMRELQDAAERL